MQWRRKGSDFFVTMLVGMSLIVGRRSVRGGGGGACVIVEGRTIRAVLDLGTGAFGGRRHINIF